MSSQIVNAFTLALLHFVWQGAILTALAAAGFKLSAQSAKARYALACAVLFAMPMVVGITTVVELRTEDAGQLQAFVRDANQRPIPLSVAPPPRSQSSSSPARPTPPSRKGPSQWLGAWVLPTWLLGVALLCTYRAASWIAAQRLRRRAVCAATPEWQQRLNRLIAQLRISRPVAMLESSLTDTPLTMGVLRPVILLPIGLLAGLPVEQIELILLHELAHIRRHDYLVNLLQTAVESLLFYHPGVWWLSRRIRMEREYCCDDIVVASTGDVTAYARTLTELEQRRSVFNNAVLAATGGNLMFRIQRLLGRPPAPKGAMSGPLAIVLLLASCAALYGWQGKSFTPAPQNTVAQVQTSSPQPGQNGNPIEPRMKPNSFFEAIQPASGLVFVAYEHFWNAVTWFHQLIGIAPPKHTASAQEPEKKHETIALSQAAPVTRAAEAKRPTPEVASRTAEILAAYEQYRISESATADTARQTAAADRASQSNRVYREAQFAQAQFQAEPKELTPESELQRQITALERTRAKLELQLKRQLETPHQKWLNEEVYWIISDSERTAFQQLQTDEQRQAFIEQFWLRRDPTPDSSKNEFMEEYYRRLAYVNATFASGDLPGWKTDRGMVYIRFGAPDEIQGGGSKVIGVGAENSPLSRYFVWHYKYIESIGKDVDLRFVSTNDGGFRLVPEGYDDSLRAPKLFEQMQLYNPLLRRSEPQ